MENENKYNPVTIDKNYINKKLSDNPALKKEYDALADEYNLLDRLIRARNDAGLTQERLAQRMGKKQAAIARIERTLSQPDGSVSLATLRDYAAACGKKLDIRFTD